MASRLIYRNGAWELNPEYNGGQVFAARNSVQPWTMTKDGYRPQNLVKSLDEQRPLKPASVNKNKKKNSSSVNKGSGKNGGKGAAKGSIPNNTSNTAAKGGTKGSTNGGTKNETGGSEKKGQTIAPAFSDKDWNRLDNIFNQLKPTYNQQPLSGNARRIEENRIVYNADGGISTIGGKQFTGRKFDPNFDKYANEVKRNNILRTRGSKDLLSHLSAMWNDKGNPYHESFRVSPSLSLASFNNPISFWRGLYSLRNAQGWRNMIGNIMEYTPFGRSGRSMPTNRAYRNMGGDEYRSIIETNAFRRKPGVTDADAQKFAGTTHDAKVQVMQDAASRMESIGNIEGANLARANINKATPQVVGIKDGEPIYDIPYGGDGTLSFDHGGKYFTAHAPSNVAGRSYYNLDPAGEEYVVSVPNSNQGFAVGSAGIPKRRVINKNGEVRWRKPTSVENGNYQYTLKEGDVPTETAEGIGFRNMPTYSLADIPTGKKIFAPFNNNGVAISPSVRGMKVYREVPVYDKNYQNVVGYRYMRVPTPGLGSGFRGVNDDSWNFRSLVNSKGEINKERLTGAVDRLFQKYPDAGELFTQTNKGFADGKKIRTNLYQHINDVVKSAQTMPLPKGVNRQELVESALYHDIGKIFGRKGHATASNWLLDELGVPVTPRQYNAINQHMAIYGNAETNNPLLMGLHTADVARGRNIADVIAQNPHLAYPVQEASPSRWATLPLSNYGMPWWRTYLYR